MVRGGAALSRSSLIKEVAKDAPALDTCIDKLRTLQSKNSFMAHYIHGLTDTEQKCRTLLESEALINGERGDTARLGREDGAPPAVMEARTARPTMEDARYQCPRHGVYADAKTVPVDREVLQKLDKQLATLVRRTKVVTDGVAASRRSNREFLIAMMESRGAAIEERRRLMDANARLRKVLRTADTTRPNVYLFGQSAIQNSWGVSVAQSSVDAQRGVSPPTPLKGRAEISVQSYNRKKKKRRRPVK